MNKIEPDYNYQVIASGRSNGKTFFQNRIKQAYKSGMDDGFIEKQKLIKYLEDKINNQDIENETEYGHARDVGMYFAYQDILERVKSGKYV